MDDTSTLLARWMSGTLTPEEVQEVQSLPDYEEYKAILEGMDRFKAPEFNKEPTYQKILRQRTSARVNPEKGKIRKLWWYAAAAILVLLIGSYFTLSTIQYKATTNSPLLVQLPDGSDMLLQKGSTASRSRFLWDFRRHITLESGEAWFEVTKGDDFIVSTSQGKVEVLGTQFTVITEQKGIEVVCYEGKVGWTGPSGNTNREIPAGQRLRWSGDTPEVNSHNEQGPEWLFTTFTDARLADVLAEIATIYGVTILPEPENFVGSFTGRIPLNDLDIALQSVLLPMNLTYIPESSGNIIRIQNR